MKIEKLYSISIIVLISIVALNISSCSSSNYGKKVKEPFSGNKYESNNNWFRSVGKGSSAKDNIAKSKADMEAKTEMAGQINTSVKKVADQYLGQTENAANADIADKFQSLAREVMNTEMADLRKIGEEKFYDGEPGSCFNSTFIRSYLGMFQTDRAPPLVCIDMTNLTHPFQVECPTSWCGPEESS